MKTKKILSLILALAMIVSTMSFTAFAVETELPSTGEESGVVETVELPTATVTELDTDAITEVGLTFALNFKADDATDAQVEKYGRWFADYVLTVNKDITFNAYGDTAYLAGQYDAFNTGWLKVPDSDVKLNANEPFRIMAFAAEALQTPGLKITYNDVLGFVKDFDCGVYFSDVFLAANPDLVVNLELRLYNNNDETESYRIGKLYEYFGPAATLDGKLYFSVQDAIDSFGSNEGEYEITLLRDVTENIKVTQYYNQKIKIVGSEADKPVINGYVDINGRSNYEEDEYLEFKNVAFDAAVIDPAVRDRIIGVPTGNERYSHNVTFDSCDFYDSLERMAVVAMKEATGGSSNWLVKNCTFKGLHSATQMKNVDGLKVVDCVVTDCESGFGLNSTKKFEMTGTNIDVLEYGIRAGQGSAIKEDIVITLSNNTINSVLEPAIIARKGAEQLNLNIESGSYFSENAEAIDKQVDSAVVEITGGSYSSDVSEFVVDKKYVRDDEEGYVVAETCTTVNTEETGAGYEVVIEEEEHDVIRKAFDTDDHISGAKIDMVVSVASAKDRTAFESVASSDAATILADITFVKTDVNGNEIDVTEEINTILSNTNDTLTVKIYVPGIKAGDAATVYHIKDGVADEVTNKQVFDGYVQFEASAFSSYGVVYTPSNVDESEVTPKITLDFVETDKANEYEIVLNADSGMQINRLTTVDLTFANTNIKTPYTIVPNANINLTKKDADRYMFSFDGINSSGATAESICIGKVVFEGYGKVDFKVADADTNEAHTSTTSDNIVEDYVAYGPNQNFIVTDVIEPTIARDTRDLAISVTFPNNIENKEAGYQDMKVVISGGDLLDDVVVTLGEGGTITGFDEIPFKKVGAAATASFNETDCAYELALNGALSYNITYNITVSGAGYRTYKHVVKMTEDKEIIFWNNVMSTEKVIEKYTDAKATVTFLAGDIVKDNNINIYDLSAVVSYFGTYNLSLTNHPEYARYDLNRDGKIDSKDVAYVLVSWGK